MTRVRDASTVATGSYVLFLDEERKVREAYFFDDA